MIKYFYSIMLCCIALVMSGCSSSSKVITKEETSQEGTKEKKLPLALYESTLNPSEFDQEIEEIEKIQNNVVAQRHAIEIPKDSIASEEEVMQGFRIQVFSSSGVDEATLMKSVTMEKFSEDSVYIVYDAPVYKVRVGDFINRYEANQRLPEFVEKGYRDAWIVPDRVIQRKFIRVPISK